MNIRKFLIFIVVILLFTGCSIKKLSDDNYFYNMNLILKKEIKYSNQDAIGYQYYLPKNINVLEANDFNETLFTNGNKYYLYADVVSYYHKIKNKYKVDKSSYISKKLKYNNKSGYLEINKTSDKYYIEMMFNYAKMEAYVSYNDLTQTITDMSYILSSIRYNDDIVETLLGDQKYDLSDSETYNIFNVKKDSSEDQFLKYVNEYDNYTGQVEELIEQEEIETDKDK